MYVQKNIVMLFKFTQLLAFLLFGLFLMSPSCKKSNAENTSSDSLSNFDLKDDSLTNNTIIDTNSMHKYSYKTLWKQVDSLNNEGMYQSALDRVEVILLKANQELNTDNLVKSLMFKMRLCFYLKEDDYIMAIDQLEKISKDAKAPLKQIIYSISADVYWGYYQENRYQFMDRTETVNFENKDIRTWDIKKIIDKAYKLYQLSLSDSPLLKSKKIEEYKNILHVGNTEKLRPTLYDFLAHRALDFFSNAESEITRPAVRFSVSEPYYFGNANEFISGFKNNKKYDETSDSLSNLLYASRILVDLTSFYLNASNPEAFIDLELKRLNFSHKNSSLNNKDELYVLALDALSKLYPENSGTAEVLYHKALFLKEKGEQYSRENPTTKLSLKQAHELCLQTEKKYPKSYGAQCCEVLKNDIERKNMSFQVENAYSSTQASKFIFHYQNLDKVYFRIVPVEWNYELKNDAYGTDKLEHLIKQKPIKEWETKLQNFGDFQKNSIEYKLPELKKGLYVILASANPTFSIKSNAIAKSVFWVSDLNYISRNTYSKGTIDVYVTNRFSGEPVTNVSVHQYENVYNYNSRKYELVKRGTFITNQFGLATITKSKKSNEYSYNNYLFLEKEEDRFIKTDSYYMNSPYSKEQSNESTHFFTDRKIYRPGQTIYFKGICIKQEASKYTIETARTKTIDLLDVNYQKISSLTLTSNEYGTFSGEFKIPTGLLNGRMLINTTDGNCWINVEEYKRPKFSVSLNPIKGTFKLGQTIHVDGNAKSYAGASIENAKVQYRVVRSYSYPSWVHYRYWFMPSAAADIEIENGEVETDAFGNYKIDFKALEDQTIDSKYSPTYTYRIYVDVTDLSGETQSTQSYVNISNQAMVLNIEIDEEITKSKATFLKMKSSNLMGQKIEAKGQLKFYELIENTQVLRNQRWASPNLKNFTEEEYIKLFPFDAYDTEKNSKLQRGKLIGSINFDTGKTDSIPTPLLTQLKAGRYQIEAESIDSFGSPVLTIKQLILLDEKSKTSPTNEVFHAYLLNNVLEPGETCNLLVSSALPNTHIMYEIEHKGEIIHRENLVLNNSQQLISIKIKDEYRGNFTVHFTSSKIGDYFTKNFEIIVPHSDKVLDIQFETFRDKLSPGQAEEWKLKIEGPKGEKVAAEMLASMYDASLDQFASNSYYLNVFPYNYSEKYWSPIYNTTKSSNLYADEWNDYLMSPEKMYDQLNWFGYNSGYYAYKGSDRFAPIVSESVSLSTTKAERGSLQKKTESNIEDEATSIDGDVIGGRKDKQIPAPSLAENKNSTTPNNAVAIRSNFNETAFFFPHLTTDSEGSVIIKFTIPESLTKWKFIALAHTKDLKIGNISKETITQKELMVTPFTPRFLREADQVVLTAKVDNLSDADITNGSVQLQLFDAKTDLPIDDAFSNTQSSKTISVKKDGSTVAEWQLQVPYGIEAVKYRVVAKTSKHTDGEENILPVLSNRMLVTESMPLPMKTAGIKEFTFQKLLQSGTSKSIKNHSLTLEYTSNPAWYAVQALPYMMEFPYECAEQVFSRFYSNSIASNIIQSNPKIKSVFESWKNSSPEAFLSNLEKNQNLKSLMIQETPWVLQAKNEQERKKRISLLFDFNKMDNELKNALDKLEGMQSSNGGWPWFKGMKENRYITQHIVAGMGHLNELGIKNVHENSKTWNMIKKAVQYLDKRIVEDYNEIKRNDKLYLSRQHISAFEVHYLYTRSFFKNIQMNAAEKEAIVYFQNQAKTYWKNFDIYNEGMIALQAQRNLDTKFAQQVLASLKERAIIHDELGMYWKDNVTGYYWYQAPIETQALLIEAFDEITNNQTLVNELKIWLLKQKQTTDWKTTKATAEACYVLLRKSSDLLTESNDVEITIGKNVLNSSTIGTPVEAGTGYFSKSWSGKEITPEMGKISIKKTSKNVSWGAVYWQYFEDLDKITPHETPLKLAKKLFLVHNTKTGPVITPISEQTKLSPGDKVRVRIELRTDRNMEYIHLKDMRASGFEPINVLSQYKWQDGLGYYESTKDASTNFFIDFLPKGVYVFEYDLRVSHCGDFSNGISSIQCMYAPEFTSHSEGTRVKVSK